MAKLQARRSEQYGHERRDFAVAGTSGGFVVLPRESARKRGGPWIWYAPTFVGGEKPLPKPLQEWYLRPLLEEGFAVGGVDVGESWGSPAGRRGYGEFHRLVVREFDLSPKACLMPQSRGGLMLYNWAAEHADCVRCIGAIYPVVDLTFPDRVEMIAKAYGLTAEELLGDLASHNPVDRLAPLAAAGVPILHVHGDRDELVPVESNSLELVRRYRALGGSAELLIMTGKGHEEVPAFFQCHALLEFFRTLSGRAARG